ncbi:MAG: protoporphyrinogen oxidase, partial [Anaerolineales bacterium]
MESSPIVDPKAKQIVIVGGGISGLAAAYYLSKRLKDAKTPVKIMVIEKSSRWGGKILTERIAWEDGTFIIEGGPDTFLATKPWAVELCKDLGIADRLQGTNPSQHATYVLHKGTLLPLPEGLAMMIPADIPSILQSRLLTWYDKLRMGMDFIIPPQKSNGDESLGAFIRRRLGNAAYENLIEPLLSGIYAGDGDQLSLAATFPYLRNLEIKYGSLARGARVMRPAIHSKDKSKQSARSAFLTPQTGLLELITALVANLAKQGVELHLQTPLEKIDRYRNGFELSLSNGKNVHADYLILATPAYQAGKFLHTINPALSQSLTRIPYVSTATVSLAYPKGSFPHPLNGYGYVIPKKEHRQALACTWTSTKFPHRAPEGYRLLRVFIGRAGQEFVWDEAELL